jgi:hypothetical protein
MHSRSPMKAALILTCMPLLFFFVNTARAQAVDVNISNDGTEDVVVTIYDMNVNPRRVVLANARINGFSSVSISLIADASGKGRLSWTATNTDPVFPKCGNSQEAVGNADLVNVHADSSCRA